MPDSGSISEEWLRSIGFVQAPGLDWLWSGDTIFLAWNRIRNEWVIGGPGDDEEIALDDPAPSTQDQVLCWLEAIRQRSASQNDSDVAIDEEWLRSIGFVNLPGHPQYVLWFGNVDTRRHGEIETRRICNDERQDLMWSYHVGRNEVMLIGKLHPKTRGQLRKLLELLK